METFYLNNLSFLLFDHICNAGNEAGMPEMIFDIPSTGIEIWESST